MPVKPSYPWVYIQEVSRDVHTITPVLTATTAFVGRARRGPVDDPVVCNGFADFEQAFGGLWSESKLGFAVRDFFLNGGSQAVIVRVFHSEPRSRKGNAGRWQLDPQGQVARRVGQRLAARITLPMQDHTNSWLIVTKWTRALYLT
jgi:hypothetical protein